MPRHLSRTLALAALLALCGGAFATADTPSTAPSSQPATTQPGASTQPAKLDKLLAALSSDDWKQRQQAADALADLDPSQIPRLQQAVDAAGDVDLRNTLLAAIKQINERTSVGPSLISLNVKDAPAAQVLKAIAAQINFDLMIDNTEWLNDIRVTVSADRQPFWAVMKALSPQWPVRLSIQPNDPSRITLQSSSVNYLTDRSVVAGPLLICPTNLQTNSSTDLMPATPALKSRMVTLQMTVLTEPKLHASRMVVSIKEAVDENGKVLNLPDPNGRNFMGPSSVSAMATTAVRLMPPADAGKKIARLAGTVSYRVPTRIKHVELADFGDGKKHAVDLGGRQIDVTVTSHDKFYDVKLAMPANTNLGDELSQSQTRDIRMVDSAGNPLFRRSIQQAINGRNWDITVTFSRDGTPIGREVAVGEGEKVMWDLPVETREVQTPFELTNIPLTQ